MELSIIISRTKKKHNNHHLWKETLLHQKERNNMIKAPKKCPMCNEEKGWKLVGEDKTGFSGGKSAAGAILFGPVGLVGGALGKKRKTYACANCQFKQEYKK